MQRQVLFVNLASQQQAELVANVLSKQFLKVGGIVTTVVDTPQQWDSPNGWAPLQWFAVKGLRNYGIDQLATRIMKNWLTMVEQDFIEINACWRNITYAHRNKKPARVNIKYNKDLVGLTVLHHAFIPFYRVTKLIGLY